MFRFAFEFDLSTVNKPTRSVREHRQLFTVDDNLKRHLDMLKNSLQSIVTSLKILWIVSAEKNQLADEITYADQLFSKEVKLSMSMSMSIRRFSPLTALAILSDDAYLRLVPRVRESGTTSRHRLSLHDCVN
jgi:hypothetical protein